MLKRSLKKSFYTMPVRILIEAEARRPPRDTPPRPLAGQYACPLGDIRNTSQILLPCHRMVFTLASILTTADIPKVMNREFFTGKKVLVMGLGRFGGGVDVVRFAAACGSSVMISDSASPEQLSDSIEALDQLGEIEYHLGSHDASDFEQADVIVANPAVAPDNEFLEIARRAGRLVTSQIGIFFELCPAPIIGITGANGKSTTAALTAHILSSAPDRDVIASTSAPRAGIQKKTPQHICHCEGAQRLRQSSTPRIKRTGHFLRSEAKQSPTPRYAAEAPCGAIHDTPPRPLAGRYEKALLSGNIGNRPLLAGIDEITPQDLVVLELSSFQLEQLAQTKKAPKLALLTNLTPNHLDRHGTFAAYCAAKENIFKFQKLDADCPAVSIFNAEDEIGCEWFEKYSSDLGRVCIKFSREDVPTPIRESCRLPGRANLSNLAAAIAIARCFHVPDDVIEHSLPHFKPLPHRLELIAQINGVRWYNDSIATTPESAIAALDGFDCPRIIIAGGYDKNLPFNELGKKIAETAKAAVLLGQTAQEIAQAIQDAQMSLRGAKPVPKRQRSNLKGSDTKIEIVDSLAEAVALAARLAVSGDVVLLSPACASYDMFDNFQQRGQQFVKLVGDLSAP